VLLGIVVCVVALGGAAYLIRARRYTSHSETAQILGGAAGYVSPQLCAACHQSIWESYRRTGMARSFYRPTNGPQAYTTRSAFYHKASNSYFEMLDRGGKYYQRRYQIGLNGEQSNVMEKEVHFIMGSGNHVRTFLHRTSRNTLVELPLAWYAENGGYWAMNPGYDRPDHPGFRRTVTYDCMFCHNGYPEIPAAIDKPGAEALFPSRLPEGIDCQRCHGPGGRHVRLAQSVGIKAERIRSAIVNPSRLSTEKQMEVCMQCHLETTSFPLPNSIRRYERGAFSYQPGEPLANFILYFDHAPGRGRDDKFEIVSAAYRLRRSACFQKSGGALLCTTCHNPHRVASGEGAARRYASVCRQCHTGAFDRLVASSKHPGPGNCIECHMPKRRTEDVVHAVMTDHYIQRRKPDRELLEQIAERHETNRNAYRGDVVLYYPQELVRAPEKVLYLAIAQVSQSSNLTSGIAQLTAAIDKYRPGRAEYYFQLAEALRKTGQIEKAVLLFQEAVRRNPKFTSALIKSGALLKNLGQYASAAEVLNQAIDGAPDNASAWHEMGLVYLGQARRSDAIAALEKSVQLDPDAPEPFNSLGGVWFEMHDSARAKSAFQNALRIQPDYAEAQNNLANLLSSDGEFLQSRYHFEIALRLQPDYSAARYNYGVALARVRRFDDAERQIEAALRADPALSEAHEFFGNLLLRKGNTEGALRHYREALNIRPEFDRAHLSLGATLAELGDVTGAEPHLRRAAESPEPSIREQARQILLQLKIGR
jgi:predicted CXXCH cytochrome family protein